jgi:hypothetical protein
MTEYKNKVMELLVGEGKLKRADILVTRTKRSLLGALIRFGTKSHWNHGLMVYTIKDDEQGYNSTFIIESGGAGIDVHNISHYLERLDKYDVGIKRFEPDWFNHDTAGDILYYRRKVRGFALQEIDDKYDHKMILSIASRILRQIILGILFPLQRLRRPEKRKVQVMRITKLLDVNAYICSGFVQWAYYQAVSQLIREEKLGESCLQDIIFNPRITPGKENDLLSTTPADLANSDKLSWKYVIIDGNIQEVSSPAEVDRYIKSKGKST